MNPLIQLKTTILPLLMAVVGVCFALLPSVQATPDPGAVGGGNSNAADGFGALNATVSGINNSGFGANALHNLTTGNNNAAQGNSALNSNTNGNNNTALGVLALRLNVHGDANTAVGKEALLNNTGEFNTAVGWKAGSALTTGFGNIDIGFGVVGVAAESNTIRIGDNLPATATVSACFIGGIGGQLANGGTAVYINEAGKLGTNPSSARFKDAIKPMDNTSEAILALKPVTFRYKQELDPKGIPQFGLVAEDVEKVNPDLVVRDAKGEIYSVRYEAVNAMLLNEFLKEHRKNEEQQATIARLQKQIDALTAGLQKVSAQVEMNRTAPQVVNNP